MIKPQRKIGTKNCINKKISKKLDRKIKRMQKDICIRENRKKVSYVLASDELAKRMFK